MFLLKNSKFVFSSFLLMTNILFSQQTNDTSIVILPFIYQGLDQTVIKSSEAILKQEIQKNSNLKIINDENVLKVLGNYSCDNFDCAVDIGKKLGANYILICKFLVLGQKNIIQFQLISVPESKKILIDDITSPSIEDLQAVMKRIAISVVRKESISKTAEIGNITKEENINVTLSRQTRKYVCIGFGYLFPIDGYGIKERSFTMDFKGGGELENFNYGLYIFARHGFGISIFSSYLISQKDFSPYIGAGFGFHWINHEESGIKLIGGNWIKEDGKKGDGLELLLNTGIELFHTYNFRINLNFSFSYTFNDFNSTATVFTIGVSY